MRRTDALTLGVLGQQLELLVPGGRPTSATFGVFMQYGSDDVTPEWSGAAIVDAPDTMLSGPAGPSQADPYRLPLTSTTGLIAGRRYLLEQNGLREWLTLSEVGADYARSLEPLQSAYAPGATFQSTWISAGVDDDFIADPGSLSNLFDGAPDYRVKWTILVAGQTAIAYSFFDVVRAVMSHAVTIKDVDDAAPGLLHTLPVHHRADSGRSLIERAWSSVRAEFAAMRIDVNALRESEVIDELVILRTLLSLAEGGWAPPGMDKTEYMRRRVEAFDRFIEKHFKVTLNHAVGVDSVSARPAAVLFRK
jgi:hypothetical protein